MSNDGKYDLQIKTVKQECPDSSENDIFEEFKRYEE
jgi:hypothetical protein